MKKTLVVLMLCAAIGLVIGGCGDGGSGNSSNYVGTFKATNSSTGQTVTVVIAQDDGTHYVGNINNVAISGDWGSSTNGIMLSKGSDTNHIGFSGSVSGGSGVTYNTTGTLVRQ